MDPPADPAAAEPMPEKIVPMMARTGTLPRDDEQLGVRDQVGRRARDRLLRARAPAPAVAQPATTSRRAIPSSAASTARSAATARSSTARSSPSTTRAGRASARCSGACTSRSESAVRRLAKETPVTYVIFDLLWLDGHSLMGLPYSERRARLAELELDDGEPLARARLRRRPRRAAAGGHRAAGPRGRRRQAAGLAPTSPGGAAPSWVKIKNVARQEVVIGGWMPGEGRRRDRIGALLVGVRDDDGDLRYVGRVGTGFTEAELDRAGRRAACRWSARTRRSRPAARSSPREAVFVEPRAASPRSSSASGPTDGAAARAVLQGAARRQAAPSWSCDEDGQRRRGARSAGREVELSNLDKVLYPEVGFTKRDVIDYYARIAPVLLPHLDGRAADAQALPQRRRRRVLLREERARRTGPTGSTTARDAARHRLRRRRRPADARLARQPRRPRAAHVAARCADDPDAPDARRLRPRPRAAGDDRRVLPRRACCAGMFDGLGLRVLRQDLGLEGHAGLRAAQQRRRPTTQTKAFAKAVAELLEQRGARARRRRGRPRPLRGGQGARRLEPERRATRRRSTSTRCAPGSARPSRRRSRGTRSARARRPDRT